MEIIANIPITNLPSTNKAIEKARYNRYAAASEEKELRQGGHDAAIYWMQQVANPVIDIEYVWYNRTGHKRGRVENILRAARPVFTLPVKLTILVPPARDIDGFFVKPILDGFSDARLYEDDWLIDELTFRRDYSLSETNNSTVVFQIRQPGIDFEAELAWTIFKNRYFQVRSKEMK